MHTHNWMMIEDMKLSELTEAINKFASSEERGKRLKAKKIRKVVDGLKKKQKKLEQAYAKENSTKAKKKLGRRLKVVKAQIIKGSSLLKKLDT